MMNPPQEVILAKERPHWGIFIPACLVVAVVAALNLPVLMLMHMVANLVDQLKPQPLSTHGWYLLILIPDGAIIGVSFLAALFAFLKSEVKLTNKRLTFRTGFLARISSELLVENIESTVIVEPILGRFFGYGTILVAGLGGSTFPLTFISSPQRFHAMLQKAVMHAKASAKLEPEPPQASRIQDDSRYMPKGI